MTKSNKADFCIEIDFQKGSESPSRVFRTMTELIETFESIDSTLIRSINTKIKPITIIEDIESGSIKAWLGYVLREVEDDALKKLDWRPAIGKYLVRAKYLILDFIDKRTEIKDRKEIEQLEKNLLQAAEETEVNEFPSYSPVERQYLLPKIGELANALKNLNENDKAIYIYSDNEIKMNAAFHIVPESLEELLTQETIATISEMILKVKRPDYLGESMWDFRHGKTPLTVKILDEKWLADFQSRKYDVRPGDSLRAIVRTEVKYGYDGEVVGIHYIITEVKDILKLTQFEQLNLLKDKTEPDESES